MAKKIVTKSARAREITEEVLHHVCPIRTPRTGRYSLAKHGECTDKGLWTICDYEFRGFCMIRRMNSRKLTKKGIPCRAYIGDLRPFLFVDLSGGLRMSFGKTG